MNTYKVKIVNGGRCHQTVWRTARAHNPDDALTVLQMQGFYSFNNGDVVKRIQRIRPTSTGQSLVPQ